MTKCFFTIMCTVFLTLPIWAQTDDKILPNPDKISIIQKDKAHVTITGESESLAPSQCLAIYNMYTNHVITTEADADGSFTATIFGHENMPYIIFDSTCFSDKMNLFLGSLPIDPTILYSNYETEQPVSFGIGGWVSYGWIPWVADGTINSINFTTEETILVSMEVTFQLHPAMISPDYDFPPDYEILSILSLRQVTNESGEIVSEVYNPEDIGSWSSNMTSDKLPINEGNVPDIVISTIQTSDINLDMETGFMTFNLNFETSLEAELPQGQYIPVFEGELKVGEEFVPWYANRHFALDGTDGITIQFTMKPYPIVLPLIITISNEGK